MVELFNNKQIVSIGNDILREGWLEKESRYRKKWRTRWCVLTKSFFFTFEEEKDYTEATETIPIDKMKNVRTDEIKSGYYFKILLDDRTYIFKANSFEDKEGWIAAINKAMITCSKEKPSEEESDDA